MSNAMRATKQGAKADNQSPANIRELAAKERKERAERAGDRLRDLLKEEDCELRVSLMIGNQPVPLEQIVALPGVVRLVPK